MGFFRESAQQIGRSQPSLAPGQKAQLIQLDPSRYDKDTSPHYVLTIVPPNIGGPEAQFPSGFQIQPIANLVLDIGWGDGAGQPPHLVADVGRGARVAMAGSALYVTLINRNKAGGPTATNAGAFISPGDYAGGRFTTTVTGLQGGTPVSAAFPLNPPNTTDKQPIPAYASTVTLILEGAPTSSAQLYFLDLAGGILGSVQGLTPLVVPQVIPIPASAAFVQVAASVLPFIGVSYTFGLNV